MECWTWFRDLGPLALPALPSDLGMAMARPLTSLILVSVRVKMGHMCCRRLLGSILQCNTTLWITAKPLAQCLTFGRYCLKGSIIIVVAIILK